jgi:hypothetical protein
MTHTDNSTEPTSGFFAGTVNTDDRPTLAGLDRKEFFFHYSDCFVYEIKTAPMTWHTLNSFLPIFELLGPKFVLDQNAYVSS